MLLQCHVLSVPPTVAAKGKLLLSDLTAQKWAAWDRSVQLINVMFASAARVDSHLYEFSYDKLFFFPLCLIELLLGVQYFQILELSKPQGLGAPWTFELIKSRFTLCSNIVSLHLFLLWNCTTVHGKINLTGVFFVLPLWFVSNYGRYTQVQMWISHLVPTKSNLGHILITFLFFLWIPYQRIPQNANSPLFSLVYYCCCCY